MLIILLYLVAIYLLYTSREGIRQRVGVKKGKKKRKSKKGKKKRKSKKGKKKRKSKKGKKKRKGKKGKKKRKSKKSKKVSVCKGTCCKYNDETRYNDLDCGQLNKFCGQKLIDGCTGTGIDCFQKENDLGC
jgi:hypothetical protein